MELGEFGAVSPAGDKNIWRQLSNLGTDGKMGVVDK